MIGFVKLISKKDWEEILLDADRPSRFLQQLLEDLTLERNYPELFALKGTPQNAKYHPEGDVWTHTLMCVDKTAEFARRDSMDRRTAFTVALAVLCHDLGKPVVTRKKEDGSLSSKGHSEAGVEPALAFLRKAGVDGEQREKIVKLIVEHLNPVALYRDREKIADPADAVKKLLERLRPATMEELLAVCEADRKGRGADEWEGFPTREWIQPFARLAAG